MEIIRKSQSIEIDQNQFEINRKSKSIEINKNQSKSVNIYRN